MDHPLAKFRSPLESLNDVKELGEHTEKIRAELKKVKIGDWKILYQYETEGTYWAEEYPFSEIHGVDHLSLI